MGAIAKAVISCILYGSSFHLAHITVFCSHVWNISPRALELLLRLAGTSALPAFIPVVRANNSPEYAHSNGLGAGWSIRGVRLTKEVC